MSEHGYVPAPSSRPKKSLAQIKMDEVFEYFKNEFPLDHVGPLGKFFAKASCSHCYGRGLRTRLTATETHKAVLELCGCALKRRNKFLAKLIEFEAGAVLGEEDKRPVPAELELPINPLKKEQFALINRAKEAAEAKKEGEANVQAV